MILLAIATHEEVISYMHFTLPHPSQHPKKRSNDSDRTASRLLCTEQSVEYCNSAQVAVGSSGAHGRRWRRRPISCRCSWITSHEHGSQIVAKSARRILIQSKQQSHSIVQSLNISRENSHRDDALDPVNRGFSSRCRLAATTNGCACESKGSASEKDAYTHTHTYL